MKPNYTEKIGGTPLLKYIKTRVEKLYSKNGLADCLSPASSAGEQISQAILLIASLSYHKHAKIACT